MALDGNKVANFVEMFLKKDFDGPTEIPECHLEWWEMCTSTKPLVAIAAPRNHAKSTAVTKSYTLANLLLRERRFILLVSDTETQASFFLNSIKMVLQYNEDIRKIFGVKGFLKDTETDFIVLFEDGYQARIIAKGSEQKVRGINWDDLRPDLIVCDDMENDEIVMNEDRRKKFRDWFSGALVPCRARKGIVRYVGTILHQDSMLERLMPKEYDKRNVYTPLSVKNSPKNVWWAAKYRAHSDDFKHLLWEERWSKEDLQAERQHFISQGQADKYSQEYLNIPIDESNAFFKRGDFIPMKDEHRLSNKIYYVGCDLAVTTTVSADHTVFVVGGVDAEGVLNIVDVIKERMDSVSIVDTILELNKRYDPQYFFFEKGAITNSVLPHLTVKMIEENNYVALELFARVVDKKQFAHTIQARLRTKRVRFDKEGEWYQGFESEMMRFPRDMHDDQVDAIAILGHGVNKFVEALTPREQRQEDYEEEMFESGFYDQGRSAITGY